MLSDLFDSSKTGWPIITLVFAATCLIVSIPTMFFPDFYQVFGGYKPLNYPWQKFTLAFQHGFHGFPSIVHLAGNGFLLWFCGVFAEKILGSARFLILTCAAMLAFAAAHSLPWIDGHGSSGVIWAYSPIVFVTFRAYSCKHGSEAAADPVLERGKGILIVMWVAVTVFMAVLPYLFGWRGNVLVALALGNTFHISATLVGFVFAVFWRKKIEHRLAGLLLRRDPSAAPVAFSDKVAVTIGFLMPVLALVILTFFAFGKISVP